LLSKNDCYDLAMRALAGAGNPLRQWIEWTGLALHVRRRLTRAEQERVGPVLDLRGTEEAQRRLDAAVDVLPPAALEFGRKEIVPRQCIRA
jgi:hypothetical protein